MLSVYSVEENRDRLNKLKTTMYKKLFAIVATALSMQSAQAIVLGQQETNPADRVSIRASNMAEFPICGGTMLTDQWVMTAAHCVVMGEGIDEASYYVTPPGELAITARTHDLNDTNIDNYYPVSHVVVHPKYTRIAIAQVESNGDINPIQTALDSDIALLYLTRPVSNVNLAELATKEEMIDIEARLTADWDDNYQTNQRTANVQVFGWGATTPAAGDASTTLRTTSIAFLPIDKCYERLEISSSFPGAINSRGNATKICTLPTINDVLEEGSSTQYGNSACNGDSGGPLLDIATGKQIGIVSGTPLILPSCGSLTIPSFYTKVSQYYDWVQSYTTADTPPSRYIIAPDFITKIQQGNTGYCNDGIATNNCNFIDRGDSGGSFNLGLLSLLGLLAWRRRSNA